MNRPFDSVILIAFGGPSGRADIRPFLRNVLQGRRISEARLEEVVGHYELFDGVSPITDLTLRQAQGLERTLAARGLNLPTYVGMRNWHPYLRDTLWHMAGEGRTRAIGFIMAPHRSYSSCQQYRENVESASRERKATGRDLVEVYYVPDWHRHPNFIGAQTRRLEASVGHLPEVHRRRLRVVFTAHSLPKAMPAADRYREQLNETAQLVAEGAGLSDWAVVFQSRSGRPEDPWLGPDILEYLRSIRTQVSAVAICPVGFVCDHIEVLYDLDHEALSLCRELELPAVRAATVNDDPLFIQMMADVVERMVRPYESGRPLRMAFGT